jgi:hypothetical protein
VPDQLAALDAWIAEQKDRPSRPEAVRRLLGQTLKTREPPPRKRK